MGKKNLSFQGKMATIVHHSVQDRYEEKLE